MKKSIPLQVLLALTGMASMLFAQEAVVQWQRKAVRDFPEIGLDGSPMNEAFVQAVSSLKNSDPGFFNNPKWPYLIAEQVAIEQKPIIPGLATKPQEGAQKGGMDAPIIAAEYRSDQRAADARYFGKRIELNGEILRITRPSNSVNIAFVYLKTADGLPAIKVELNKMKKYGGKSSEGYLYSTKEGYEFRVTEASSLEVRTHKRSYNRYYYNHQYSRNSIQNGDWFPIISKGEKINVVGTCDGLKFDVVLRGSDLQRDDDDLP